VDILSDGRLDFPDSVLATLDYALGAIHTGMEQDAERITGRLVKAMENPHIHAIAHPTGRLLGRRDAYALDFDRLLRAASATGTALEINAHYERLDLNDVHSRAARDAGVKLVLGTDAHDAASLRMMRLGVATARRGWARPEDILNTLPADEFLAWAQSKRER
jgi:DNA polymerase (family 10)